EYAPGQEVRQQVDDIVLIGDKIPGELVDFSHGDVDAFTPIPGAQEAFQKGYDIGGKQAYNEYCGSIEILKRLEKKLSRFTGSEIRGEDDFIITPGTQGALFLAIGATVSSGDRVAIVEPDYFANRKLVEFSGGEIVPISMDYESHTSKAGLNITELEEAFKSGVKLFLFSNPNNPTGVIYSDDEIRSIADLAKAYEA